MLEINKIYNTNCIQGLKQLDTNCVNLLLTNIPFNVINRTSNGLRSFDKKDADVLTFDLSKFLDECNRVCCGSFYIFCSCEQLSEITIYFTSHKITRRLIVSKKINPCPINGKTLWLSGVEVAVYAKKKNAVFNDKFRNTVLEYPCSRNKYHPTEKNINMLKELIRISSNEGDLILDPCVGGGGSCVAAKELGRNFIGFDINSEYCKISRERLGV